MDHPKFAPRISPATLLLAGLLFSCVRGTLAETQNPASRETTSACSVKQTDDSASAVSEIFFSGLVRGGEDYQCNFIRGFAFQLKPTTEGWEITIHEDNHDENVARPEPPGKGMKPLSIAASDFRNETGPAPATGNVSELPQRKFTFSPIPAHRGGSVTITNVKLGNQSSIEKANVAEMSFDVSIHLETIDGVPIYSKADGASPPKLIRAPDPEYSKEALKANYQGTVVLSLIVGPDGSPKNVKAATYLGMGLDQKAIDAVRQWRFKPGTRDGVPVPVRINVEVTFHR